MNFKVGDRVDFRSLVNDPKPTRGIIVELLPGNYARVKWEIFKNCNTVSYELDRLCKIEAPLDIFKELINAIEL